VNVSHMGSQSSDPGPGASSGSIASTTYLEDHTTEALVVFNLISVIVGIMPFQPAPLQPI
jgi:hypothetical protein